MSVSSRSLYTECVTQATLPSSPQLRLKTIVIHALDNGGKLVHVKCISWLINKHCTCATLNFIFSKLARSLVYWINAKKREKQSCKHDLLDHPWHWTLRSFFHFMTAQRKQQQLHSEPPVISNLSCANTCAFINCASDVISLCNQREILFRKLSVPRRAL